MMILVLLAPISYAGADSTNVLIRVVVVRHCLTIVCYRTISSYVRQTCLLGARAD